MRQLQIQQLYKPDLLAGLSPLSDTLAVKTSISFSFTVLLKTLRDSLFCLLQNRKAT